MNSLYAISMHTGHCNYNVKLSENLVDQHIYTRLVSVKRSKYIASFNYST